MTIHVFATILALYPIKTTAEIAEEFGMTEYRINKMAKACRVKKSHEFRSEVNSKNGSVNAEKLKKRTIRRAKRVEKLLSEGYSQAYIAKKMNVTPGTITKYRSRIKK